MKSRKKIIGIVISKRILTEPGIYEDVEQEEKVKVTEESIYQSRLDVAALNGLQITGRYRLRTNDVKNKEIKYIIVDGNKFKISTINYGIRYSHIEAGELI